MSSQKRQTKKVWKLTPKQRYSQLEEVVYRMKVDEVIKLEEVIEGRTWEKIEKEIGSMSSNQWRNCLVISLEGVLGL